MSELFGKPMEEMGGSVVLPSSFYPVTIYAEGVDLPHPITPSSKKGTPGLEATMVVDAGPAAGHELNKWACTFYFSGKTVHFAAHLTKAVTGKPVDYSAFDGFTPSKEAQADEKQARIELAEWLEGLTPEERCNIMAKYVHATKWHGKKVIAKIECIKQTKWDEATGKQEVVTDEAGQPRWQNKVTTLYALTDSKHGMKAFNDTYKAQQAEEMA